MPGGDGYQAYPIDHDLNPTPAEASTGLDRTHLSSHQWPMGRYRNSQDPRNHPDTARGLMLVPPVNRGTQNRYDCFNPFADCTTGSAIDLLDTLEPESGDSNPSCPALHNGEADVKESRSSKNAGKRDRRKNCKNASNWAEIASSGMTGPTSSQSETQPADPYTSSNASMPSQADNIRQVVWHHLLQKTLSDLRAARDQGETTTRHTADGACVNLNSAIRQGWRIWGHAGTDADLSELLRTTCFRDSSTGASLVSNARNEEGEWDPHDQGDHSKCFLSEVVRAEAVLTECCRKKQNNLSTWRAATRKTTEAGLHLDAAHRNFYHLPARLSMVKHLLNADFSFDTTGLSEEELDTLREQLQDRPDVQPSLDDKRKLVETARLLLCAADRYDRVMREASKLRTDGGRVSGICSMAKPSSLRVWCDGKDSVRRGQGLELCSTAHRQLEEDCRSLKEAVQWVLKKYGDEVENEQAPSLGDI